MRTLLLVLMVVAIPGLNAGELDELRTEVRTDEPTSAPPRSASSSRSCQPSHEHGDDAWDHMLTSLFGPVLFSPWLVPHAALEGDRPGLVGFVDSPYADDHHGYMLSAMRDSDLPFSTMAARLSIEQGSDFDTLSRTSGRLLWETKSRWGLDSEWDYRYEHQSGGTRDQLWTGDANVIFRFAQGEWAEFHTGLGLNWLHEAAQTDVGFNFTYGADFFPSQPWIISTTLDAGTLGSAGLIHARGSLGYIWRSVELYAAYDYYRVAGFRQQGPAAGVRWWW